MKVDIIMPKMGESINEGTIIKWHKKVGDPVKKDEIIVKIDSREIENNLYSLRSDFINAIASMLPDLKVESDELYSKWSNYFSIVDIHENVAKLPEISNLQEKIKLSSRQIFSKYYTVKNQEILLSMYQFIFSAYLHCTCFDPAFQ
jgi:multidrug efflux pump subunit AcrA (membrane-fusion protein)